MRILLIAMIALNVYAFPERAIDLLALAGIAGIILGGLFAAHKLQGN